MRVRTYLTLGIAAIALAVTLASCGDEKTPTNDQTESTTRGNIKISVDEGFMPVLVQELHVFDSSYPEGHITAAYRTEKQCFEDLFKDSARLIITSRDLTPEEKKVYENNQVKVRSLAVAMDAIAVIVHPGSEDSLMTLGQLKQILLGKFARQYTVVFDNAQSGIIRYMLDSLIPGQQLSSNIFAVKNNDSLIAYVAKNEKAIGFVGVTHIYDPESSRPEGEFKKQVSVVSLKDESDTTINDFYQPYQAWIAQRKYPLRRPLYFITRDSWSGLGTGFANFLSSEPGQLIFSKARLIPLRVSLRLRPAEIK